MPVLSPSGFVRLAWMEWGAADARRTAVCVHGLTRNARDFDALAQSLASAGWRVAAVDVPGRGRSEWLRRPQDYGYPFYAAALAALIGRLGADTVDWVGTSMGGLIGMMLAAQPAAAGMKGPIRRLVLNDIGPFIPKAALARIAEYVGPKDGEGAQCFADLAAVEAYLRRVHAPFGALSDEQWRHLALHSAVAAPSGDGGGEGSGGYRLHYDPAIAQAFAAGPIEDVALWPIWEAVAAPTLVLRGAASDLLAKDTADRMARRGTVRVHEIAGAGHAPALMADDQIALIRGFLAEG
jgi:pimeloyl-ACP methyl ester carboxylesterase